MSGERLFGRVALLRIGDVEVLSSGGGGLRMRFEVVKQHGPKEATNTARVEVYNLAEDTRGRIDGQTRRLFLEAGFDETSSAIFCGDRAWVSHKKTAADWVSTIIADDGGRALTTRVVGSWAPNTTALTIFLSLINQVEDATQVKVAKRFHPEAMQALQTHLYPGGRAIGPTSAKAAMETLAHDAAVEFSVQDCEISLLPRGKGATAPAPLLAPGSGLIGGVEVVSEVDPQTKTRRRKVQGRCLLNPRLLPGRGVQVDSGGFSGVVKLLKVRHTGDTHGSGDSYATAWEGRPL